MCLKYTASIQFFFPFFQSEPVQTVIILQYFRHTKTHPPMALWESAFTLSYQ